MSDMKRIYTLLFAIALVPVLNAQRIGSQHDFNSALRPASEREIARANANGQENLNLQRGAGGDFFCEDFANGIDGNNPFGAWTIEDSGNNTIWMEATANSPAGEFSTNIAALNSPTGDNGWMIFDCDFYNTPIADGFEDVTGWLYTPVIDMTAIDAPIVEWYQYFRYCCFPGSPLTLEVTNDGGSTWVVFDAHGIFIEAANEASANPLQTRVDISCVAANQAAVQVRFGYNSAGNTGYSHYYWGIDDVCIYDNTVNDDLEVLQIANGDIFNWWEYRTTPFEQRILTADDGLIAGTVFQNNGKNDQTNCVITIDILDDQMSVVHTISSAPFDVPANANAPTCPHQKSDTLYIATDWEPTGPGMFYLRSTITSDAVDEDDTNDSLEKWFAYSDDVYGHEDVAALNGELFPRESDLSQPGLTLYDPTGYGCYYHVPNEGSTAYGLTIHFGPGGDQGNEFEARLYQGAGDNIYDPNAADIVANSYWTYDEEWGGAGATYLPFEYEYELLPGEVYFVAVINEFESEFELTCEANLNDDTDNSSLIYEITGGGDFVWFTSQTPTPAVDMIIAQWVGISELGSMNGIELHQNMPNPAADNTIISYSVEQAMSVQMEIRDLQGRLIQVVNSGTVAAGQHQIQVDTNSMNAGIYTYTLIANDNVRLTKRMIVR